MNDDEILDLAKEAYTLSQQLHELEKVMARKKTMGIFKTLKRLKRISL